MILTSKKARQDRDAAHDADFPQFLAPHLGPSGDVFLTEVLFLGRDKVAVPCTGTQNSEILMSNAVMYDEDLCCRSDKVWLEPSR